MMTGCARATLHDFDDDGDLDIALIAIFPDWTWDLPQTFVYLENQGNLQFSPYSLPKENFANWTTIVSGDVNGDGKKDIGLGNIPLLTPPDWTTSHKVMAGRSPKVPSILYLLNNH